MRGSERILHFSFLGIIIDGHLLFGGDFLAFYLGMRQFLFEELSTHHSIPFWNPYIFGGMPFWAHFESTIFYPLGFLFWFVTPSKAYGYTMFIHLLLAGLFMYLLARSLEFKRTGSFVAGAVFMCNGFVVALIYLGHLCPVQSYIWLPLVIYFLNKALASNTPHFHASMAGAVWGVQILAGAPQDAFYAFIAAMVFLICSVEKNPHVKPSKTYLKRFIIAAVLFLVGASLSSIQILPAFELIQESVRSSFDSYEMTTMGSYPLEGVITTVLPHFFGNYTANGFWVGNTPWSVPHQCLYVGILPLTLLLFISYRDSINRKVVVFAVTIAIFSFILALGHNTPFYKLAHLLPGFDRFRMPSKIIVLWVFSLALLAGRGIDDLSNRIKPLSLKPVVLTLVVVSLVVLDILFYIDKSLVLKVFSPFIPEEAIPDKMAYATDTILNGFRYFTILFAFIALIVLWQIRLTQGRRIGVLCLCAVLIIDLTIFSHGHIQYADNIYSKISHIKKDFDENIGKDKGIYRVGGYNPFLGPNFEMIQGYQTVSGYTALYPTRYYNFFSKYIGESLEKGAQCLHYTTGKNSRLMDLLNVKYEIVYDKKNRYLHRKTAMPRALFIPHSKMVNRNGMLVSLLKPDLNFHEVVLFEKEDFERKLPPATFPQLQTGNNEGKVRILSYRPDQIVLDVNSTGPGYLLLSEVFYPGWKAFIDDQPTRVLRGNYLFRAIELPEGRHIVRFVFTPLSINLGISITILALFMLTNIIVFRFRKRLPFLKGN